MKVDHRQSLAITRIRDCAAVLQRLLDSPEYLDAVAAAADVIVKSLRSGKKVLFFGNGGSAADAQHLAAELNGRFLKERPSLPGWSAHDECFDIDGDCERLLIRRSVCAAGRGYRQCGRCRLRALYQWQLAKRSQGRRGGASERIEVDGAQRKDWQKIARTGGPLHLRAQRRDS